MRREFLLVVSLIVNKGVPRFDVHFGARQVHTVNSIVVAYSIRQCQSEAGEVPLWCAGYIVEENDVLAPPDWGSETVVKRQVASRRDQEGCDAGVG